MNRKPPKHDDGCDAIATEAAAWFARLRSDACGDVDRAGFVNWLSDHDAHRVAYVRMVEAWAVVGGLAEGAAAEPDTDEHRPGRTGPTSG